MPLSYGGLVFISGTVSLTVSSIASGILMQRDILRSTTQMILGGVMMGVAFFITYPPPSIRILYEASPILAFPGIFLACAGEIFSTLAAIRVLNDTQERAVGVLTPCCATMITGLWVCGSSGFYFTGNILSGFVIGKIGYGNMGLILTTGCLLSVLLSLIMKLKLDRKHRVGVVKIGPVQTTVISNPGAQEDMIADPGAKQDIFANLDV